MNHRNLKLYFLNLFLLLGCVALARRGDAQKTDARWKPEIPKTWVDSEIAGLEIPLSDPASGARGDSAGSLSASSFDPVVSRAGA